MSLPDQDSGENQQSLHSELQRALNEEQLFVGNEPKQADLSETGMFDRVVLDEHEDRRVLKKRVATFLMWLTSFWTGFLVLVVLLSGTKHKVWFPLPFTFELSDGVLITILATTTTTVVGMFAIIVHNAFPKDERKEYPSRSGTQ